MQQLHIAALSEDVIFYGISAQHLRYFQQLAYSIAFPTIPASSKLNAINPFITAANIWFSLHIHQRPNVKQFYLDEQRRFAYGAAYFQLEYIERHRAIRSFMFQYPDERTMIVLSYTLSIHCMDWLLHIMEEAQHFKTVSYYLDEENFKNNVRTQGEDEHQAMQKAYMRAIIQNIHTHDGFNMAIQYAIRDAHRHLGHDQ